VCRLLKQTPECNDSLLAVPTPGGSGSSSSSEQCNLPTATPGPLEASSSTGKQCGCGKAAGSATTAAVGSSHCPVEQASSLSYYQFVERYMAPNLPVLIKVNMLSI
jgi:hypothetical protein